MGEKIPFDHCASCVERKGGAPASIAKTFCNCGRYAIEKIVEDSRRRGGKTFRRTMKRRKKTTFILPSGDL